VAPAATIVLDDDPWTWPAPYCMAYSPRIVGYACVSLHASIDGTTIEEEMSTLAMTEMLEFVRRRKGRAQLGIDLVSAHGSHRRVVIDTVFDSVEPLAAVQEALARHGYTVPITARAVLEADAWIAVGEVELRYSWHRDENPPSFDYQGRLELRCTPAGPVHEVVLDPFGIGGPLAAVSSAKGTKLHAITVEHRFGGEGFVTLQWMSWLFDEARWCPDR
jgi:hypothetical protein